MTYSKEDSHSRKILRLTSTERLVYDTLAGGLTAPDDLNSIARRCHLTVLQVTVAIQLLSHKRLLPGTTSPSTEENENN